MRAQAALALILLILGSGVSAAEMPQVTMMIVETDPASPATLHGNDNVYVHFHYTASAPIRVWVTPYSRGQRVSAITDGSPPYPAGEGDGFGWFACNRACTVDSIHLQAAPEGSGYPAVDQSTDEDFTWDGEPGSWHTPAAWVKPFQDKEAAREIQAYNDYMSKPLGASGIVALVVFGLMLLAVLFVCVIWPLYGVVRWQGKWRWLAAVPLVVMALKTIKLSMDLAVDPTGHNLLPFEYLIIGVIVAPYMIIIWALRKKSLKAETE